MRWPYAIATIMSGLMCAWALVAWARSYVPPHFYVIPHRGQLLLAFADGQTDDFKNVIGGANAAFVAVYEQRSGVVQLAGFARAKGTFAGYVPAGDYYIVAVPFWFIVLLTAIGPVIGGFRYQRRRRRVRHGGCPACGYDLRATPERCPECGWTDSARTIPIAAAGR